MEINLDKTIAVASKLMPNIVQMIDRNPPLIFGINIFGYKLFFVHLSSNKKVLTTVPQKSVEFTINCELKELGYIFNGKVSPHFIEGNAEVAIAFFSSFRGVNIRNEDILNVQFGEILLFLTILKKRAFTKDSKIKDDEVIERLRKITLRVDKLERMYANS